MAAPSTPPGTIEVFFSYAHEDEPLLGELIKHLSILKRLGVIRGWHDRQITAGTEWKGQIDRHLDTAGVILLLVSADFVDSDYCWDVELKRALERHDRGEARVIPVILRHVDNWHAAPFGKLQAVPTDGRPVTDWPNRDQAFADVAGHIRRAVEELAEPKTAPITLYEAIASKPQPASTIHQFNPKYYVYISRTKVEMFYRQISPVFGGSRSDDARSIERDLYGMTDAVSEFVLSHLDVGAVSQPKSYISDRLELRWGTLWDSDSDLAVFGNTIDETVLALIGSSSSLLGQGERVETEPKGWNSINYYHMGFINQYIESSPKDEREARKYDFYEKAMNAAVRAIDQLPEFTQPLEFLAKTLYTKEFKDRLLIVATPIYVALAE